MHDQADRNSHSSSMMLSSPNRLLNMHQPKLARPVQQQNLAKKMKVNHVNGNARPTPQEGTAVTVRSRSSSLSLWVNPTVESLFDQVRKVIRRYGVPYDKPCPSLNNLSPTILLNVTKSSRKWRMPVVPQRAMQASQVKKPSPDNCSGRNDFKTSDLRTSTGNPSNISNYRNKSKVDAPRIEGILPCLDEIQMRREVPQQIRLTL